MQQSKTGILAVPQCRVVSQYFLLALQVPCSTCTVVRAYQAGIPTFPSNYKLFVSKLLHYATLDGHTLQIIITYYLILSLLFLSVLQERTILPDSAEGYWSHFIFLAT